MKRKEDPPSRRGLSTAAVMRALNLAVQDAVELHRRNGLPLAVWRDGKVVMVPAEELASIPKRRKSQLRKKNNRREQ